MSCRAEEKDDEVEVAGSLKGQFLGPLAPPMPPGLFPREELEKLRDVGHVMLRTGPDGQTAFAFLNTRRLKMPDERKIGFSLRKGYEAFAEGVGMHLLCHDVARVDVAKGEELECIKHRLNAADITEVSATCCELRASLEVRHFGFSFPVVNGLK